MDAVKDSMMVLNLEYNCPIVLISELSHFHLGPVEPVMVAIVFGINVLKFPVLELSLEVVVSEGDD